MEEEEKKYEDYFFDPIENKHIKKNQNNKNQILPYIHGMEKNSFTEYTIDSLITYNSFIDFKKAIEHITTTVGDKIIINPYG
jgi:hypothetical protein